MRPSSAALVLAALLPGIARSEQGASLVSLQDIDPSIALDIRYAGDHNFIGRPIRGYDSAKCLLTRPAAEGLRDVQKDLKEYGLSLKVYDCFRPQRAVDDFVAWAKDKADVAMKKEFYPNVDKADLFKDGYIAAKSGHSRGSTMDLTIDGLDMGTGFDFFDPLAHTANPAIGAVQRRNRLLLKLVMEKHSFKNLPDEWWHFTLKNEPYPDRYFDFALP